MDIESEIPSTEDVDRISSLTDEVGHKIVSKLDVEDLCRLMLVSKKSMDLCMSAPSLSIDNQNHSHDSESLNHYHHLVNNFLSLRKQSGKKVTAFSFTWRFVENIGKSRKSRKRMMVDVYDHGKVIRDYFKTFSDCGADVLRLNYISEVDKPVPFYIGNFKKLHLLGNKCTVAVPEFFKLPPDRKLEVFVVENVNFSSKISHLFNLLQSIKTLWISGCTGVNFLFLRLRSAEHIMLRSYQEAPLASVEITCPQLKTLSMTWYPNPSISCPGLTLRADKLESFKWHGVPLGWYNWGNFCALDSAEFSLKAPFKLRPRTTPKVPRYALSMIIARFTNAKSIKLHSDLVMLFYGARLLSSPLRNTETLTIEECYLNYIDVNAIAQLLIGMVDLKSLCVTTTNKRRALTEFNARYMGDLSVQKLEEKYSMLSLTHLNTATVEVWNGGNDLEFVKFLLKKLLL